MARVEIGLCVLSVDIGGNNLKTHTLCCQARRDEATGVVPKIVINCPLAHPDR